jgi:hypothetical protein
MSLTKLVGMPNLGSSGGRNSYVSDMQKMVSNKRAADAAEQAAVDNQIFRQATLDQGNARLGILGAKNEYDMQGGARDIATASKLAGVNSQLILDAASAKALLEQQTHDKSVTREQAQRELDFKRRTDMTLLANGGENSEVNRIFTANDIGGDDVAFQAKYNPRQTSPLQPGTDQSEVNTNQFVENVNENRQLYLNKEKIEADTRSRMIGYPEADILAAVQRNTSMFVQQSPESLAAALAANKSRTDAMYGVYGNGSGSANNSGGLALGGKGQGEAIDDADFTAKYVSDNNIKTEANLLEHYGNLGWSPNQLDVTQENLATLSEPMKILGIKAPAFFAALASTGTMVDNEWKDLDPKEMLMPKNKDKYNALIKVGKAIQKSHDEANGSMSTDARVLGINEAYKAHTDESNRINTRAAGGTFGKSNLQNLFKEQVGYSPEKVVADPNQKAPPIVPEPAPEPGFSLEQYAEDSMFSGVLKPAYDIGTSDVPVNAAKSLYDSVNQRPDFSMEEYAEDSIFSGAIKPVYDAVKKLVTKTESEIADIGSKKKQISVVQKQIDKLPPMQQRTQAQKLHAIELGKLVMKINAQ